MLPHFSALLAIAVSVLASARMERHMHAHRGNTLSQCDTGAVMCCNGVTNATDIADFLDHLGYSYDLADSVGINCIPINVFGAGQGAGCAQLPVCCSNNYFSGFINIGCSPFDIN